MKIYSKKYLEVVVLTVLVVVMFFLASRVGYLAENTSNEIIMSIDSNFCYKSCTLIPFSE